MKKVTNKFISLELERRRKRRRRRWENECVSSLIRWWNWNLATEEEEKRRRPPCLFPLRSPSLRDLNNLKKLKEKNKKKKTRRRRRDIIHKIFVCVERGPVRSSSKRKFRPGREMKIHRGLEEREPRDDKTFLSPGAVCRLYPSHITRRRRRRRRREYYNTCL